MLPFNGAPISAMPALEALRIDRADELLTVHESQDKFESVVP